MKNKRRFAMVSVAVIVVALLLEAGILKYVNDANAYRLSKVLLDRVVTVLDKNDQSEEELIESLKDDYIVRAKAVSYIVDAKPQVENDVEELQKIAKLMSVDEIHLFDETGCITSGSVATALIREPRFHILNQCSPIKALRCARMSHLIHQRARQ
jgi:hypothetical protein